MSRRSPCLLLLHFADGLGVGGDTSTSGATSYVRSTQSSNTFTIDVVVFSYLVLVDYQVPVLGVHELARVKVPSFARHNSNVTSHPNPIETYSAPEYGSIDLLCYS